MVSHSKTINSGLMSVCCRACVEYAISSCLFYCFGVDSKGSKIFWNFHTHVYASTNFLHVCIIYHNPNKGIACHCLKIKHWDKHYDAKSNSFIQAKQNIKKTKFYMYDFPLWSVWTVTRCALKLCLCLNFLLQIWQENLGSTPHSNRTCRTKCPLFLYER